MKMTKTLKIIFAVFFLIMTVFFLSITIQRASLKYNENGVYFDEQSASTYNDSAISAYGLQAILFCIPAVILLRSLMKRT